MFALERFHKSSSNSDGRHSSCAGCRRAVKRRYLANGGDIVERARRARYHRDNAAVELFRSAKKRAKMRGIVFTLEPSDVVIPTECPVFGTEFDLTTGGGRRIRDAAPTLDRIVPAKGYVPGNVAVISWRANRMKHYWLPQEIHALADWLKRTQPQPPAADDKAGG